MTTYTRWLKGLSTLALIVMSFAYSHLHTNFDKSAAGAQVRPTPGLPPRSTPGLPSRPTREQTAEATPLPLVQIESGAIIELHVALIDDDLQAIVQWRDSLGGWHDVEGWRNHIEPALVTRWWVAPDDLASGPFRWIVYKERDDQDKVICSSPTFMLPVATETLSLNCITV
jgi:hypothetical protein